MEIRMIRNVKHQHDENRKARQELRQKLAQDQRFTAEVPKGASKDQEDDARRRAFDRLNAEVDRQKPQDLVHVEYRAGSKVEVPDDLAYYFIHQGWAVEAADTVTPVVDEKAAVKAAREAAPQRAGRPDDVQVRPHDSTHRLSSQ